MPYEDDSSVTIPPDDRRHRRRTSDHVSMKRIVLSLLASTPLTIPGIIQGGRMLLDVHEEWVALRAISGRVESLQKENESLKALLMDSDDRIALLERWHCRLGWDPPRTRDPQKECK